MILGPVGCAGELVLEIAAFYIQEKPAGLGVKKRAKKTLNHCRLNSYLGWIYVHQKFAMNCQ